MHKHKMCIVYCIWSKYIHIRKPPFPAKIKLYFPEILANSILIFRAAHVGQQCLLKTQSSKITSELPYQYAGSITESLLRTHGCALSIFIYVRHFIYNDYQIVPGTRWGGSFEHWKALQEEDGLQESLGAEATRCSSCGGAPMNLWIHEPMSHWIDEGTKQCTIRRWINQSMNQGISKPMKQGSNEAMNQ